MIASAVSSAPETSSSSARSALSRSRRRLSSVCSRSEREKSIDEGRARCSGFPVVVVMEWQPEAASRGALERNGLPPKIGGRDPARRYPAIRVLGACRGACSVGPPLLVQARLVWERTTEQRFNLLEGEDHCVGVPVVQVLVEERILT